MPPFEDELLTDTALLWRYAGKDRFNKPRVLPPVEIDCKWNQIQQTQTDPQARVIQFDATVIVDQDIPAGSILWFGTEEEFIGSGSAELQDEPLFSVDHKEFCTDLKGRETYRQLILKRYMGVLPQVMT